MPKCYPISLNIEGRLCLVVGGGKVAERKVLSLLECGALVRLVSPDISEGLKDLALSGKVKYFADKYSVKYLDQVFLVIGATNDDQVNAIISSDCLERGLLINIVDDPPRGNFYVPAVVRRGHLQIAVSTDGKSPLLARKIRERLENDFPLEYGDLVDLIGNLRESVIKASADGGEKDKRLSSLLDGAVMELLRQGKFDLAKERILNAYTGGGGQSQDCPR